jgi:hypothetical protein
MRVEPLQRRFLVWKIGLGLLALRASLDVFFHEFSESGSFVQLLHKLPCIRDPWMAPCWAIVDFSQYSSSFLDVVVEKKFSDRGFGVRCRFGGRKKSVVKEDAWFIGVHLLVKVLSSGKEIGDSVRMTWNVGQFIVKILEVLDPVGLATSNLLRLAEVLEVLVVSANLNQLCSAEEEGSTTFESKEDRCEFFVMGVVVLFGREETSGVEGDWVNSIVKLLQDDGSEGISRGVGFKDKSFQPVGAAKRRECGTRVLQTLEGLLFAFRPLPLAVLAGEVVQGLRFIREMGDEDSVKVAEAKKDSYILHRGRDRPFHDAFDFGQVHLHLPLTNDDAEVFNFLDVEVALLWFEVEIVFFKFLQNLIHVASMLFLVIFGRDDDIIHVDFNPSLGNFFLEDVVHHRLKCGG